MSSPLTADEAKKREAKASENEKNPQDTPTDRDHYVYETIIAEIGY